jgi:hypothetical protein
LSLDEVFCPENQESDLIFVIDFLRAFRFAAGFDDQPSAGCRGRLAACFTLSAQVFVLGRRHAEMS